MIFLLGRQVCTGLRTLDRADEGLFILLRAGQADHANGVGPKRARRSLKRPHRAFDSFGEGEYSLAKLDEAVASRLAVNERLPMRRASSARTLTPTPSTPRPCEEPDDPQSYERHSPEGVDGCRV